MCSRLGMDSKRRGFEVKKSEWLKSLNIAFGGKYPKFKKRRKIKLISLSQKDLLKGLRNIKEKLK